MSSQRGNKNDTSTSQPYRRNFNVSPGQKSEIENNNSNASHQDTKKVRMFGVDVNDIFEPEEVKLLNELLLVRFMAFVAWTCSILYATYHVYLACEVHLGVFYDDPVMNPGSLSTLLNRGKDSTDDEYEMFLMLYISRLWFWYGLFAVLSQTVQPAFPKEWKFISVGLTLLKFGELIGLLPTISLLIQSTIYWMIAKTRSKLLMWTVTMMFIYNLNAPVVKIFIPNDYFAEYFFVISTAWNCCRCISFCCDVWNRTTAKDSIGITYLGNVISFCFYLPLAVSGPLVTYESFERCIINKDIEAMKRRDMTSDFIKLLKTIFRLMLIILFMEMVLHLLYFRALAASYNLHRKLSLWAICGTIYWLGQFFSMKYKILYGFPSCIAEFDGMEMHPLPTCPSYMHRYSALWRDFDRGLYRFLVNYIYVPVLTWTRSVDKRNLMPVDIHKLIASFMTFVYVYVWHSLSFDVFVWTALNFIGITIERIGSLLKKEIDKRMTVLPIFWDFVIEPIVTVPLAAMSILNSSIFCGSLDIARSFAGVLWKRRADNWVLLFLYFFTHTAVTHRTWRNKLYQLFSKK